jgi:hypothetical protein
MDVDQGTTFFFFSKNHMRTLFLFLFFIFSTSYGQTKEALISAIIELNILHNDDDFNDDMLNIDIYSIVDSFSLALPAISVNNFNNFNKLKKLLSKEELIELTTHNNNVLRLYAIREVIHLNSNAIDLKKIIINEAKSENQVTVRGGCSKSEDPTYLVIYYDLKNKVAADLTTTSAHGNELNEMQKFKNSVDHVTILNEVNEALIQFDKDLNWLIYKQIFEQLKPTSEFKNFIVQLLYKFNNSYAFDYLKKHFSQDFNRILKVYFEKYFDKHPFETSNQQVYFYKIAVYAHKMGNPTLIKKIHHKIKSTKSLKKWGESTVKRLLVENTNR